MSETTVTMSLARYRELEAFENAINVLKTNPDYFYYSSSYGEYIVSNSNDANLKLVKDLKSAIEQRDVIIYSRKVKS